MSIYQITLRDRETQTVVGYFNAPGQRIGGAPSHSVGALLPKPTPPGCAIAVRGTPSSSTSRRSLSPTSTKRGNAPRAVTVRAKDRVIALRIPKEPFMRMVREFPTVAVSIMQELAQRLAEVTELAVSTDGTKPGSR